MWLSWSKFWMDIAGLWAGGSAVPVVSLPIFPQRATDSSHLDPTCFWKHSEILMAFIRFFCVRVYHPGQCSKWTEAMWEGDVSHCKLVVGQERSTSSLTLSRSRSQKWRVHALFYTINFNCTAFLWYLYTLGGFCYSAEVQVMPTDL